MYASEERGFDGGKKVKGRKRHVVSDTMGNLLAIKVHAANIHDTVAGEAVFRAAHAKYPSRSGKKAAARRAHLRSKCTELKGCAADAGYRKTFVNALKEIGIPVDIIEKVMPKVWSVLPIRWIVERSFGWASHSRRLSKDYEISTESAEGSVVG